MRAGVIPTESEYPLGRRIAVFGKGGKTTLSKALAERFGLEFVELDELKHQANWTELPADEHREAARARLDRAEDGWVSDGNYGDLRGMIYERAETVIVLALPWRVMAWRTFKRSMRRVVNREELWNGNRESLWTTLFSRDSVVYDLYRRRKKFMTFAEVAEAETPNHIRLVIVHTARELDELYAEYELIRR